MKAPARAFGSHAHGWKNLKIQPPGGKGVPQILFRPKSYFFVTNTSLQNFKIIAQSILGEKFAAQKEEKRKKNNHKNSGHFVPQPQQRVAQALRLDQKQLVHRVWW